MEPLSRDLRPKLVWNEERQMASGGKGSATKLKHCGDNTSYVFDVAPIFLRIRIREESQAAVLRVML